MTHETLTMSPSTPEEGVEMAQTHLGACDARLRTVGEFIVQSLKCEDVRHVFGYPGAAALPIYDALFRLAGIEHVLVRHEQGAIHAADGFARASGKVGVCLVSSGPGVTNSITGIATAFADSIPLVILTGQAPTHALGLDAFQEVDTIGLTRSCVKHSFLLTDPETVEMTLRKAFHLARSGRPGPVLIDIPRDISATRMRRAFVYPDAAEFRRKPQEPRLAPAQLDAAARAIANAERPLIYYGGGVVLGDAARPLRRFVEVSGAPVTSTLMGLGAISGHAPQFLGMLGMHGLYEANMAMQHCDVLVSVGARFDDRVIGAPDDFYNPKRRIIHVDIDPTSVDKRVRVDMPMIGTCSQVLDALSERLEAMAMRPHVPCAWLTQIALWKARRCLDYPQPQQDEIKPQAVLEKLSELAATRDMILTSDVGQHQMWAAQHFKFTRPRQWINSGGLGTMGFGLPAAIGAKIASPGSTVVCITGDGSIQMSTRELSTCLQEGLAIKVICLNNRSLGMVRQQQDLYHGARRSHSYMDALPDFVKLAEAYGHRGLRVERHSQLDRALAATFSDHARLVFLEIMVDASENVYPTLAPGMPLTQMIMRPHPVAEDL